VCVCVCVCVCARARAGDWTQGLTHAEHLLRHWATLPTVTDILRSTDQWLCRMSLIMILPLTGWWLSNMDPTGYRFAWRYKKRFCKFSREEIVRDQFAFSFLWGEGGTGVWTKTRMGAQVCLLTILVLSLGRIRATKADLTVSHLESQPRAPKSETRWILEDPNL
jgi:hypothetical protein